MTAKNGKPCPKCGANEWYKNGSCAPCAREYSGRYHRNNRAAEKEKRNQYLQTNRKVVNERNRLWMQAHYSSQKEKQKQYRQKNSSSVKKYSHDRQQANPEIFATYNHRRRTKKTMAGGSYTAAEWKALVNHFGGKCLCCGRDDVKLTADHVIPVSKGGTSNIENIQPLCKSCNSRKNDKTIDYRPGMGLGRWIQRKLFG